MASAAFLPSAEAAGTAGPIDGTWKGTRLLRVEGSLEGGFKIYAAESWTVSSAAGCTVSAGTLIEQYTPAGGSKFEVRWLNVWVPANPDAPGAKCEFVFDGGPITVTVTATKSTLTVAGCGGGCALTGEKLTRTGGGTTTTKPRPTTTKPPPTTKPPASAARGWLEVVVRPVGRAAGPFRICVKALAGERVLCYPLRAGQVLVVSNHGTRTEWSPGTRIQACQDVVKGWATPGCLRTTIRKGANRLTFVIRPDTSPPVVRAFKKGVTRTPSREPLEYTVEDDSGTAILHAALFEGGTKVKENAWPVTATGKKQRLSTVFTGDLVGPLYYCLWAEDSAQNRSKKAPESSCAWISLVVPIHKVSNGCGGGDWDVLVWAQNYFGNKHTYKDSNVNPLAAEYTVNFKAACDLHDAGYGGHTVVDTINGNKVVDFHSWSRPMVDDKFLADMRTLCERAIPGPAKTALANCKAKGGNVSLGAQSLYNFVNKQGWRFFDADPTKPGLQKRGPRCSFRPCG